MTIGRAKDAKPRQMVRVAAAALAAATLFGAAAPALAQNALGDGHLLDANLSTTSRYNQPKQGFLLNRINEAIVTGTAPGGSYFRGDVGYSSPFAFRGTVAGRSVFDFERGSYYSGIGAQRGAPRQPGAIGAYQVPRGASTAAPSPYSAGATLLTPMSGSSLQQIARARYGSDLLGVESSASAQQFRPQRSLEAPSLEATSNSVLERNLDVATRASIGTVDPLLDRTSLLAASASGALGRRSAALAPQAGPLSGSDTGSATRDPLARGIDRTFDGVAFAEGWSNRIAPPSAAAPVAGTPLRAGQDSYADLVARIAAQRKPTTLPDIGQPYGEDAMESIRQFSRDWMGIDPEAPAPTSPSANPIANLTDERIAQIRQPLPTIGTLAGDNSSQFAGHVRTAEKALAEGRYFDAESWFDVALYFTADHPLAVAGRVHAQIGSGKYRSAAVGLRRLFEAHPELINTRYTPNLLPQPDRIAAVAAELETMLAQPGATIEAGLLLGYLGHLTDQPELIIKGLDDLKAKQPDDALQSVLRRVWLSPAKP